MESLEKKPRLRLVTVPSVEPITLANFKAYAKIDANQTTDDEDDLISDFYIPTARQYVERYINRALITQTWELTYDWQPTIIEVPLGQLQSITSIKTIAIDGTETTESSDNYSIDTGDYGRVWLKSGYVWTATERLYAQFKIHFVAGYGAAATNVPAAIKLGILRVLAYMFDNREAVVNENKDIIGFLDTNLAAYKIWRIT